MSDLSTRDIKFLPGVGPKKAELFNKELKIFSFEDLLYYFPYKYIDRSRTYKIKEIDGNMPYIQLRGEILSSTYRPFFGRNRHYRTRMV